MFIFTKPMAEKLCEIRKRAHLTQVEVGLRMGMSKKSAQTTIARLEKGTIKNPGISMIIDFLIVCNADWRNFIEAVHQIWAKTNLLEVVPVVNLPAQAKIKRKVDRDVSLYAAKITGLVKPIDKDSLKDRIERKVRMFLFSHKIEDNFIPTYLDFAFKVFEREFSENSSPVISEEQFIRSGIRPILFNPIKRIVIKTIRTEQKRIARTKPISSEKQKKMTDGYLKFRKIIEPIEMEVHKLLDVLQVKEVLYLSYKNYARECYKYLRKWLGRDELILQQKFNEASNTWQRMGLDSRVLEKVKETVIATYKKLQF